MKNLPISAYLNFALLLFWSVVAIIRAEAGGEKFITALIFWGVSLIMIRIDLLNFKDKL